jgi:hypothetical protein
MDNFLKRKHRLIGQGTLRILRMFSIPLSNIVELVLQKLLWNCLALLHIQLFYNNVQQRGCNDISNAENWMLGTRMDKKPRIRTSFCSDHRYMPEVEKRAQFDQETLKAKFLEALETNKMKEGMQSKILYWPYF